jgi:hypothetical protein
MEMRKGNWVILTLALLIICFAFNTAHAQSSYPNLGIWVDQWFKVSITLQRLYFPDIGVAPDSRQDTDHATGYLKFTEFYPSAPPVIECEIYVEDESGDWQSYPFDLTYVGGDDSNFAGWATNDSANQKSTFTFQVKGTQKKDGTFSGSTIKTLGGYNWEIDDVPGSPERWVGSLKFTGSWVNPMTLCKSPKNSSLPLCPRK